MTILPKKTRAKELRIQRQQQQARWSSFFYIWK